MSTPYTRNVVPADNWIIIPPANAVVDSSGQIVMDMSGEPGGPVVATTLSASGAVDFDSTLNVDGATTTHALAATGAISATSTVTAGTGLVATTGGVTASAGNIVATLGNITASAGNISATLGSVTAPAVVATTSLTLTGASVVGLDVAVSFLVADLRVASGKTYRVASPFAGAIVKVWTNLQISALAAGDAILTGNIGATPITDGVITIAEAGSAEGTIDSCTPTAANVVVAGSDINFVVSGANTSATSQAQITVVIRRSA